MPRYRFHTEDGECLRDEEGTELPDLQTAKIEAGRVIGEALAHRPELLFETNQFSVIVADESDLQLFRIDAILHLSPSTSAGRPPG